MFYLPSLKIKSIFVPLGVLFALYGLETGVAIVQAYVFSLLTCIYLAEVMEGAH